MCTSHRAVLTSSISITFSRGLVLLFSFRVGAFFFFPETFTDDEGHRIALSLPSTQANKVVVVLQGRYAGKKAVIVKNYDEGTNSRPYGHALVCGLATYPRKVRLGEEKNTSEREKIKSVSDVGHRASRSPGVQGCAVPRAGYLPGSA